ncbi:MAG: hypothetical protein RL660_541, partial [Bacteroidota bacterium]
MKRRVLLGLAVALCGSAAAQNAETTQVERRLPGKAQTSIPTTAHGSPIIRKTRGYGNDGVTIGTTFYDLQSNGSMSRRIVNYGNNRVSAVWTYSSSADAFNTAGGFADRGTGYNHNNGTAWGPAPTEVLRYANKPC